MNWTAEYRMRRATIALAALALSMAAPADGPGGAPPVADHHLHLRSAEGAAISLEIGRLSGEPPSLDGAEATTAGQALAALDAAGIERGLVLSIAYQFGYPDLDLKNEAQRVRRENEYVAAQVATAPERLFGACSVNPLKDYALDEVCRCAGDPRISAMKLHLANSGIDLRDEAHVSRLTDFFRSLEARGLPAIVHLRARSEDYGAADAEIFIDRVLSAAPSIPVQLAHMGGWGGYDAVTDEAMGAFAEALADGRLNPDRITFDLAAVVFLPEAAGDDEALAQQVRAANESLAERIREIGTERVLFATDWPSWPPVPDPAARVAANVRLIRTALPLTAEELDAVFRQSNEIPGPRSVRDPNDCGLLPAASIEKTRPDPSP